MTLREPAPVGPLLRSLRQRRHDVDIVLLPPADTLPPDLAPCGEATCRTVERHVAAVLDALADRLGPAPGPRAGFWWQQRHPLVHRRVGRLALSASEQPGVDALRDLARTLIGAGWDARPVGDHPPRLRATSESLELVGTATDGLAVEVRGEPLHITPDVMAALHSRAGVS